MKQTRIRRSPEEARRLLIDAVKASARELDFNNLTVQTITQRAGMTRSAFYHYYSGIDELVLGLLEDFEEAIRASVNPWLEGRTTDIDGEDYRAATRYYLEDMFEVFLAHKDSVGAVAQAAAGNRRVFDQWQTRVIDYFVEKTAGFIRHQVTLGRSQVSDPDGVAYALILMNNAVRTDNMTRPDPQDAARTAEIIAGIWNAAIFGAEPGGVLQAAEAPATATA